MPLEIIGAGFGRTGTLSTCTALNDRAAIQQTLAKMTRGAYAILALGLAAVGGLAYGALRWLA